MKWRGFSGVEADTEIVDHQHLSNCVWFSVIFGFRDHQEIFKEALVRRFNNKILPYRPHPLYNGEINGLINAGMIFLNDLGDTLIIVNRRVIGEVLKSTHPLYYSTKM